MDSLLSPLLRSLFTLGLVLLAPAARSIAGQGAEEPPSAEEALQEFESRLRQRLSRHPFFKRVAFEWVREYEDFLILVQKPAVAEAGYVEKAAKLRSAESQVLNLRFRQGFAKEHGLSLRDTSPRLVVVVLATAGDFGNYFKLITRTNPGSRTVFYNPAERLLVTCQTPFRGNDTSAKNRRFESQERASQLVHAYSARSEALPEPYWFQRALITEICGTGDREWVMKGVGKSTDWSYHLLVEAIQEPEKRTPLLPPWQSFVGAADRDAVLRGARDRASAAELRLPMFSTILRLYDVQSGAFLSYLLQHPDEELRGKARLFVEHVMKSPGRTAFFEKDFRGVDWLRLEASFWHDLVARHAAECEAAELDAEQLDAFLFERAGGDAAALASAAAAAPVDLLAILTGAEERLALAIACVRSGDSPRALELLDEGLAGAALDEVDRERLERERVRVAAWIALCERYARHLVDSGDKLSIELGEKRLVAEVQGFEEGRLVLGSNNRDLESLELRELDPVHLARRMGESRSGFEPGWAMPYPIVLDPKARATRWLKGEEPERRALAQDDEHDYPARSAWVAAAGEALVLATAPSDGERVLRPELAEERLALVESLWGRRESVPFVGRLESGLRGAAAVELGACFDQLELGELLAGQIEHLHDGRVRLRYDFDDAAQLADWPLDELAGSESGNYPPVSAAPSLEVKAGRLVGLGPISRSHLLGFRGPQSIVWRERTRLGGGLSGDKVLQFRIALCTEPGDSYAATFNSLFLSARDPRAGEYVYEPPPVNDAKFDVEYDIELVHDGESTLNLRRDGRDVHGIPVGSRLAGRPQLWFNSDYAVEIDELELVGEVDESSLAELRERHVLEGLTELDLRP